MPQSGFESLLIDVVREPPEEDLVRDHRRLRGGILRFSSSPLPWHISAISSVALSTWHEEGARRGVFRALLQHHLWHGCRGTQLQTMNPEPALALAADAPQADAAADVPLAWSLKRWALVEKISRSEHVVAWLDPGAQRRDWWGRDLGPIYRLAVGVLRPF